MTYSSAGPSTVVVFFFNDTAATEIYTLSLHYALPILCGFVCDRQFPLWPDRAGNRLAGTAPDQRIRTHQCSSTPRSEEHTSELQSQSNLVCRLLLEKKNSQR